jgi:fructokinase
MSDEPGLRLGIDLGGSKIEFIAFDAAGRERLRRRVPTPRNDYRATLAAIHDLVVQSERELGAGGSVGIGTPGSLSRATGRLRNSNSVCLNGQMIVQRRSRYNSVQRPFPAHTA